VGDWVGDHHPRITAHSSAHVFTECMSESGCVCVCVCMYFNVDCRSVCIQRERERLKPMSHWQWLALSAVLAAETLPPDNSSCLAEVYVCVLSAT
jgi:hypothetical protein